MLFGSLTLKNEEKKKRPQSGRKEKKIMAKVIEIGLYWVAQFQTLLILLCAAACVFAGIKMLWGDDEDKAKARKNLKWVVFGAVLVAGATFFAKEFTTSLTF